MIQPIYASIHLLLLVFSFSFVFHYLFFFLLPFYFHCLISFFFYSQCSKFFSLFFLCSTCNASSFAFARQVTACRIPLRDFPRGLRLLLTLVYHPSVQSSMISSFRPALLRNCRESSLVHSL